MMNSERDRYSPRARLIAAALDLCDVSVPDEGISKLLKRRRNDILQDVVDCIHPSDVIGMITGGLGLLRAAFVFSFCLDGLELLCPVCHCFSRALCSTCTCGLRDLVIYIGSSQLRSAAVAGPTRMPSGRCKLRKGRDARQAHLVFGYATPNAIVWIAASP